tara:strand:+ start:90 stop:953 length:864 start_codon:yes stop_codon:yes gene_type:complete
MIFSCDTQDKQTKLSLKYEHHQRSLRKSETPVRHNIKVEPNIAEAWLDSNMSAIVEVPVNTSMYVDYKNYTFEQPDIYYEYGTSNPFYVTNYSPDTVTISISVAINSDYPVEETETIDNETTECTENCTVDNETIIDNVTYTDNATWSDNFTYNTKPTQNQKTVWENFWDNISISDNWSYVSVGHINDVTFSCDNKSIVTQIITQIQNDNITNWNTVCDNVTWVTGGCGQGIELKATVENNRTGDCRCATISDNTTTIRPAINNKNWGGVGKSCSASSQTLQVILKR